jgi:hypothetical protein
VARQLQASFAISSFAQTMLFGNIKGTNSLVCSLISVRCMCSFHCSLSLQVFGIFSSVSGFLAFVSMYLDMSPSCSCSPAWLFPLFLPLPPLRYSGSGHVAGIGIRASRHWRCLRNFRGWFRGAGKSVLALHYLLETNPTRMGMQTTVQQSPWERQCCLLPKP